MVAVAGEQQGFGQGSTQVQNGSGSLEKLGGGGWTLMIATSGGWGPWPQRVQRWRGPLGCGAGGWEQGGRVPDGFDGPRTEQLQVREVVHEVGHTGGRFS